MPSGTVTEQTVLGSVDFDGDTVGTGLLELSALKVRPERIILLTVYYITAATVKDLIIDISPPDRPLDRIEFMLLETPAAVSESSVVFDGMYVVPKLADGRNFDIRFRTTSKTGDGTVGFDFTYKAF